MTDGPVHVHECPVCNEAYLCGCSNHDAYAQVCTVCFEYVNEANRPSEPEPITFRATEYDVELCKAMGVAV